MQTTEVLELLLTARYVGGGAFNSMARDLDTLIGKASGLAKMGAAMDLLGKGMVAAGVGIASGLYQAIDAAAQYDQAVNHIVAAGGLHADQLGSFRDAVRQVSDQYGQSAVDIANGSYIMLSSLQDLGLGWSDLQKNGIMQDLGAFVAAGGNGLPGSISWNEGNGKGVATDLSSLVTAYGLQGNVGSWGTILAQMSAVESASGTNQSDLMTGVLRLAPMADQLGMSLPDIIALTATVNQVGVRGSRPGVELASAFRLMLNNKNGLSTLKAMGIDPNSFKDANGNIDITTALTEIYGHLAMEPNKLKRYQEEQTLFGAVGNRSMGALLAQGMPIYENLIKREGDKNVVAEMFARAAQQMQSLPMALLALKTSAENLGIDIGHALTPAILALTLKLTNFIQKVDAWTQTPQGQAVLAHAPQLALAALGTTLGGGSLLQMGGGKLMDFAVAQDEKHAKSVKALEEFKQESAKKHGKLLDQQASEMQRFQSGGGGAASYEERRALMRAQMEEKHALRLKQLRKTVDSKTLSPFEQNAGLNIGSARAVRSKKIAKFEEEYGLRLKQFDETTAAGSKARTGSYAKRLELLHDKHAGQLKLLEDAMGNAPQVEPSALGLIGGHLKGFGKGMMAFGKKFSPLHLLEQGGKKLGHSWKTFGELAKDFGPGEAFDKAFLGGGIGKTAHAVATPFRIAGKVGKHIGGAGKVFDDTWAMAGKEGGLFNALKAGGGKLFEPLTMGIKGIAQAAMGAVPAIAGMGSALLPIIAIVLLVVGAIVIAILIFTRYRKQAEELGKAILNALLPVFNWLKTVVLAVLKSIQDAWHAHAKEVDAAMKKLFPAIQGIIPIIQAVGAVIAFIFGAIIVVIGALVNAFIAALPFIINVFTGIFNAAGALWRFFDDLIHGRFTKAIHDLMDLFHALWDVIVNLFGMLGTFIYNSIAGALGGLGDLVINAVNNIPGGKKLLDFLGIHLGGATTTTTNNSGAGGGRATMRAGGGVVKPGELTVTGEKGWEFAHFPAGTRIYTHQQSMAMLHAMTRGGGPSHVRVDVSHSGEGRGRHGEDERHPGRLGTRSPAEEYFFARRIQEQRESLWERYPNRSRQFDNDYHRAYQYYG